MLPLTHLLSEEIVKHTIRMMKKQNFDFIVAPYEAGAQLALECQKGRAQLIFSEDSDHLTYLAAAAMTLQVQTPAVMPFCVKNINTWCLINVRAVHSTKQRELVMTLLSRTPSVQI